MTARDPAPPPITIAVINHDGADLLPVTLPAVERMRPPRAEVMLLDDGSVDGGPEWAERTYPWIDVVRSEENTRRPNHLRSLALERASSRHVFLMDNDVVLRPGCLDRLLEVLSSDPSVICCTPRLVYRSRPDTLYYDGGGLHYLCVSTPMSRGEAVSDHPRSSPRETIGCGIMMVDRDRALAVGGFDPSLLLGWGDDGEFHFRSRIAGYEVLQVPDAVCEHLAGEDEREERDLEQIYNRYRLLATGYSGRALALLLPVLLCFELAITALAAHRGFLRGRFIALARAYRDRRELLRRRRQVQSLRRRPDREVLESGELMTPADYSSSRLVRTGSRALTLCLDLYWRLVGRWV